MKLNEIPESSTNSLVFGLNEMTFRSFEFEDGQYGKQLKCVFEKEGETTLKGEPLTQICWVACSKAFEEKDAWKFLKKLRQFVDVLKVADENAEEVFNQIKANAPSFNNEDVESVQTFESQVITKLLTPVLNKPMNVILHYKGKYLNIPSYKENGFEIQFGANPKLGPNLVREKVQTTEFATVDPTSIESVENTEDTNW